MSVENNQRILVIDDHRRVADGQFIITPQRALMVRKVIHQVMTEGEDEQEIAALAHELCEVIRKADRG